VLITYGDGAVMGVPAHDERDFAFAKKYQLPIQQVTKLGDHPYDTNVWADWYSTKDGVSTNSGKTDGLSFTEAVDAIATELTSKDLGEKKTTWRLRDWGLSRQRYWGTPIPIIHCEEHGAVPVPEKDLPVILPEDCIPDGSGNPLTTHEGFHAGVTCPVCGKKARRETDTMDTFVDSAWYYMRYASPDAKNSMVDARNDYWMPMDQYIGGIEHAVLHLLYARFWTKVMRDMGLVKFDEPFTNLFTQGMLSNESFYREATDGKKRWFYPSEVTILHDEKGKPTGAIAKEDGLAVVLGGIEKMSKSKNNVVEPKDIISQFGADTARLFVMFAGPPDQSAAWSDTGVQGAHRFLSRLWAFGYRHKTLGTVAQTIDLAALSNDAKKLRREIYVVLKQAHYDYERLQYNTVVSACMKLLNAVDEATLDGSASSTAVLAEGISILLRVLYPIVPHITHALWNDMGFGAKTELINAPWPQIDDAALIQDEVELMLQINGKLRGSITVAANCDKATIEAVSVASDAFLKHADGKIAKKIIVVPGRLVNIVLG
jgi:leucyl-tRNA synthetase